MKIILNWLIDMSNYEMMVLLHGKDKANIIRRRERILKCCLFLAYLTALICFIFGVLK
jgi:hypothetical protein